MSTADVVETTWTALGLIGFLISSYALWDASRDLHYVRDFGLNGAVRLTAKSTVRRELVRLFVQVLMSLAGVGAMLRPPTGGPYDTGRVLIIAALMLVSVLHVMNTLLDRKDLKTLRGIKSKEGFEVTTADTLARIELAGEKAAVAADKVATELAGSQGRADAIEGHPGEAADAASRSDKKEE